MPQPKATSLTNPIPHRLGRRSRWSILTIAALALGSTACSSSGPNPEEWALSNANEDRSALDRLSGLEAGAVAYITATVIDIDGPSIAMRGDDVMWDYDGSLPGIIVSDVDGLLDLERPRDDGGEVRPFDSLASAVAESPEIHLEHSNGKYEIGRRYGLVLGVAGPSMFSALYGHDLESDSPVPGFDSESARAAISDVVAASPDAGSTAEALALLALDYNRASVEGSSSDRLVAAYGEPIDDPLSDFLRPEGYLPITIEDMSVDERSAFVSVEGYVFVERGSQEQFALVVDDQTMGWFEADPETGLVYIAGFAPIDSRVLRLVARSTEADAAEIETRVSVDSGGVVDADGLYFLASSSSELAPVPDPWMPVARSELGRVVTDYLLALEAIPASQATDG